MDKKLLRKQIIEKRKKLTEERKTLAKDKIFQLLVEDEHFLKADFVGIFHPVNGEIDLTELMTIYKDKIFGLPKVVNDKIMYLQVDSNTKLKKAGFGIQEPQFGFDITHKLEVILVPALGMTKDNYRLGYGKGYFDKFFKNREKIYKIGIIYDDEVVEFTSSDYDIPLDDFISG